MQVLFIAKYTVRHPEHWDTILVQAGQSYTVDQLKELALEYGIDHVIGELVFIA